MTDQPDQPDRQDGNGLLPAPGTILQIGGAAPGQGWGMNVIEVRESTGGAGWRWRSITATENQWLIDALNAKVAPPTRDGAEGAKPPFTKIYARLDRDGKVYHTTAPPNPAPDAMREALRKVLDEFEDYVKARHCANIGWWNDSYAFRMVEHIIKPNRAALSAPVPPAAIDKAKLYTVLSKTIPSDMIDGIWQELNQ